MKHNFLLTLAALMMCLAASAQNAVSLRLVDSSNGEAVAYATVSLSKAGQTKPLKYVLSNDKGTARIESVKNGSYTLKAEMLGYKVFTRDITVASSSINLGDIRMEVDNQLIDAATVSAVGNPIIIKKDTIEYNADAFKTTENDVLEDLLKKLPGVEIEDDGSITVNGETIKKITIDGKTFFLDDPSVASKNLPARMINRLKVIKKKSEQAEFTGIDDGEEENVIDLSVRPGMMKGLMGNVQLGAGHDIPSEYNVNDDWRYQGNAFVGRFNSNSNISIVLNANNTNNRGANDRSGNMMGNMMGGGRGMMGGRGGGFGRGGNGITTTYMGGANIAYDGLFDGKMELGGNYVFNGTRNVVEESTYKETYLDGYTLLANTTGNSSRNSDGHSFGMRMIHKFSENSSLVFEPQLSFGTGEYVQNSNSTTDKDVDGLISKVNASNVNNMGSNRNLNTSGMLIFRQRLGIPGRTLTAMTRFSYSNNELDGTNRSNTITYGGAGQTEDPIDQFFNSNSKNTSIMGRVTYTEPFGNGFYAEANYMLNWSKQTSDKETFDSITKQKDLSYSNNVLNESTRQEIGANVLYQKDKFRAQIGFAAIPTHTYNSTTRYDQVKDTFEPKEYSDFRWNFSPQAMVFGEFNESTNLRLFYRGMTSQPSTSQLMPVPDNTDPLNISFGNPTLVPYFSNRLNADFRTGNKAKFSSLSVRAEGSFVKDPIVNAIWVGSNGAQYSMPFNGPISGSASLSSFLNTPIAKSNFSVNNMLRLSWSKNSSYVGKAEATARMASYPDPMVDYYDFMEAFIKDHPNLDDANDFETNVTNTVGVTERFNLKYRIDALELTAGARTRMNKSWYSIASMTGLTTWNNQINSSITWTWDTAGMSLKSDFDFNWYRGYTTEQPNQYVWNAEISKLIFKKKVSLSLKGYDILGQSQNITVSDAGNYHSEGVNNTLGRYIIFSVTYRFGSYGGRNGRGQGGRGGFGGFGGPGGPGFGGPGGGRRPM